MPAVARNSVWLVIAMGAALPSLQADLISHWPLDGGFADAGPAGNDALFFGEEFPIFTEGADGTGEGALSLDGVDDYIEIPQGNGLPLYSTGGAFSVAMWVKGLPQEDDRVWSESSSTENATLFNIGTERTGSTGQVDIFIRTETGAVTANHVLSQGIAFDDAWHHIAWVDDGGDAVLYIDGQPDPVDFSYPRPDLAVDVANVGGILRPSRTPALCCLFEGEIDDVRIYDHALSEEEVLSLLPLEDCPPEGDTHCLDVTVGAPPAGQGTPGIYTVTAEAEDDGGDPVRFLFRAEASDGRELVVGPQTDPLAELDLDQGLWTITVSADDDPICRDEAADAACDPVMVDVTCPAEGDTHCGGLDVLGPLGGGPGLWSVSVLGALDDSGDEVSFTYTATSEDGAVQRRGPDTAGFAEFSLPSPGTWTFEVLADDDPECPDLADDAVCTEIVEVVCPEEGDTHCDDMIVEGPPSDAPGTYEVTVLGAADDSGDLLTYTFVAQRDDGFELRAGPQDLNTALLTLGDGDWTIRAFVDDDPLCDDQADDAVCEASVQVDGGPPRLISHWTFDGGDTEDQAGGANDAIFVGGGDIDPVLVEGFDGQPQGAIDFDGVDDYLEVLPTTNLPLWANGQFSIAMWVRGLAQGDNRVWSEGSTLEDAPLFNLGTEVSGTTGQVDFFLRGGAGVGTVAGHRLSDRIAFDGEWHHIAWVDDGGDAVLYIDGIRDATDFSYERPRLGLDTTTIGGILRAAPCCWFDGSIDDVRIWNYALTAEEVVELVPEPDDCSSSGDTHCDGLVIEGPDDGLEGLRNVSVTGAQDDSGDPVLYTFVAENGEGAHLQSGPQPEPMAQFDLWAGTWTIEVTTDDDLLCRAQAADAVCQRSITVEREPEVLLTHLTFDGTTDDQGAGGNDGTFLGADQPAYVEDPDGVAAGALSFDGEDDYVRLAHNDSLPIYDRRQWSVAMWVRGIPSPAFADRRVWSESSSLERSSLFNIGTHFQGTGGQVDLFLRTETGTTVLPHRLSTGIAFDGTWHHIAWVDDNGDAVLYIDGQPDPTDFSYSKPELEFDITTVGGILRDNTCCHFNGDIDDVRVYNFALSPQEVSEIYSGEPAEGPLFHRGDPNDDGTINITDGVFVLNYLFTGGDDPTCVEAADTNDDGGVNITDGVFILNYLFTGGAPPPAPGPVEEACGPDPEGSADLGCEAYTSC